MKKLARLAIFCFSIFVLISCNSDKDKSNSRDLLSEEKLVQVLYDIHIADGLLTANVLPEEEYLNDSNIYYSVFEKNATTREQFDATIEHYVDKDLEKLGEIYDQVLEKLNRKKGELQTK